MVKRGRPTLATPSIKAEIIDRLSQGEPLADICRSANIPAVRTISDWQAADDTFSADFARARSFGHDAIAARVRHTARGLGESSGDVQRDKLIIETDLKLLAKWDKRYSDKLIVEGKSEVTHRYELDGLSSDELDTLERIAGKVAVARGDTSGAGETVPPAVH
jgi:hypothetical protein